MARIAQDHPYIYFRDSDHYVVVTDSSVNSVPADLLPHTDKSFPMDTNLQLGSKSYRKKRKIDLGGVEVGGESGNTLFIAGPCAVESEQQLTVISGLLKELGIRVLRAGCFKPRTSPYRFQGLGLEGLRLLEEMRERTGLKIITEVRDSTHVDKVIEVSDIVQIGAKAMFDYGILKACGKTQKPVLLKRGFGTTLKELVEIAEFILSGGNPNLMLCERGIRTFETGTRFTLDLCGVAYLKEYTNLPIFVDPSHAMGFRYGVADLACAAVAMRVDGLLVECHPNPDEALSDASQQLSPDQMRSLYPRLQPVAHAVGKSIV